MKLFPYCLFVFKHYTENNNKLAEPHFQQYILDV